MQNLIGRILACNFVNDMVAEIQKVDVWCYGKVSSYSVTLNFSKAIIIIFLIVSSSLLDRCFE